MSKLTGVQILNSFAAACSVSMLNALASGGANVLALSTECKSEVGTNLLDCILFNSESSLPAGPGMSPSGMLPALTREPGSGGGVVVPCPRRCREFCTELGEQNVALEGVAKLTDRVHRRAGLIDHFWSRPPSSDNEMRADTTGIRRWSDEGRPKGILFLVHTMRGMGDLNWITKRE